MDEIVTEKFIFKIIFQFQNITESAIECKLHGSKIAPISTLKNEYTFKELVKKLAGKNLHYARVLHEGQLNDCFSELDLNSAYNDLNSSIVCDKKLKYPTVCFRPNNETDATDISTSFSLHIDTLALVLVLTLLCCFGLACCTFILRYLMQVLRREAVIEDQLLQMRQELKARQARASDSEEKPTTSSKQQRASTELNDEDLRVEEAEEGEPSTSQAEVVRGGQGRRIFRKEKSKKQKLRKVQGEEEEEMPAGKFMTSQL